VIVSYGYGRGPGQGLIVSYGYGKSLVQIFVDVFKAPVCVTVHVFRKLGLQVER